MIGNCSQDQLCDVAKQPRRLDGTYARVKEAKNRFGKFLDGGDNEVREEQGSLAAQHGPVK